GEALPQWPGVCLPEHGAGVVVGVRIDRGGQPRVPLTMWLSAVAGHDLPTCGFPPRVHRPERRCGQCDEGARVLGNPRGDAFLAADEPGPDEVECVGNVAVRTGRADGCPAVAARGEDVPAVVIEHRPGVCVLNLTCPGQPDGCRTPANRGDFRTPGVVITRPHVGPQSLFMREHRDNPLLTDETGHSREWPCPEQVRVSLDQDVVSGCPFRAGRSARICSANESDTRTARRMSSVVGSRPSARTSSTARVTASVMPGPSRSREPGDELCEDSPIAGAGGPESVAGSTGSAESLSSEAGAVSDAGDAVVDGATVRRISSLTTTRNPRAGIAAN